MTWQMRELVHPPQQFQELDLSRRRQRQFRFVENEDALTLAALLEEAQKSLAVGMREEVRRGAPDFVEISRDGKETLRPKEPAVGDFWQPTRAKRGRQLTARDLARGGMVDRPVALAAAGLVISGKHCDTLQQRRFAHAVFADDNGDGAVELQFKLIQQERQAERISRRVLHLRGFEPDPPQIRRRQVDGAAAS